MKKKNLLTRVIIIAVVTIVGLYFVIGPRRRPTLQDFTWSGIKQSLRSNIRLGLDLQGGSHLVMRVKTEEFLKRLTEDNYIAAQNAAKDAGFEVKGGRADAGAGNYRVVLEPADASKVAEIKDAVEKKVELGDTSVWSYSQSGSNLTLDYDVGGRTSARRQCHHSGTEHHRESYQRARYCRANAANSWCPKFASDLLQMPGVQDPERVKEIAQGRITTRARARHRSAEPGAACRLIRQKKKRSNRSIGRDRSAESQSFAVH